MTSAIVIQGITAQLNVINMGQDLGTLKELVFTCSKDVADKIIKEGVKRGFPYQRIETGVKLFS